MDVYRETLPDRYLLIVCGAADGAAAERTLERALHRASRSGKPAVWVDCSLAAGLSERAAQLLLAYAHHLPGMGSGLVLCHVADALRQELRTHGAGTLPMAATLLDAARTAQAA